MRNKTWLTLLKSMAETNTTLYGRNQHNFIKIKKIYILKIRQKKNRLIGKENGPPRWHNDKESTCQCKRQETRVRPLGWEDPLEECMATHSSVLAWRIPWTEEPGGLQSIGLQTVRHDWATEHAGIHTHHREQTMGDFQRGGKCRGRAK